MSEERQIALLNANVACALIEAAGMTALNMQRQALGQSMAYSDEAFFSVIEKYGIQMEQLHHSPEPP